MHPRVPLLVLHDRGEAQPELGRCLRKLQSNTGHHLQRLQLMIGEDMMGDGPFVFVLESSCLRHRRSCPTRRELQVIRASRLAERNSIPGFLISERPVGFAELLVQRGTPQNPLGKRTHFHLKAS